jgi:hypothetical protein
VSRVYFHSPSGDAELRGSERAWLSHVARGPSAGAWDLDSSDALERAAEILAMVPEVPDGPHGANYLHTYLREAQARDARNKAAYAQWTPGTPFVGRTDYEPLHQLVRALKVALRVEGVRLMVAGIELHSSNVDLNTALVAGSDPVRLAAKISGWCEVHCWVEGSDRAWLAGIIDQGLKTGIYRRGLRYAGDPDGPKDQWADQGWGQVLDLLRARDDEPVVLSYSVTGSFPNREIAGWEPPPMPEDWRPDWASDEGLGDWRRMDDSERAYHWRERALDGWYDLPDAEKWERAMDGLRRERPWARLSPDTLSEVFFHLPVSVYDLLAPDRDERVRAAANLVEVS